MRFYHQGNPIAKQRHRMANGIAYDPQFKEKNKMKMEFASQFRSQGYLNALEGPIAAEVKVRYQIPKSWSKKRKITANYKTSRPDLDNIIKFVLDVLNQIAYKDDAQIVSLLSQKKYSDKPGVEIILFKIEDTMIEEHALEYKDKLSLEDLNYLIKKANRLGISGREIERVYRKESQDSLHIYFSADGLKENKVEEIYFPIEELKENEPN